MATKKIATIFIMAILSLGAFAEVKYQHIRNATGKLTYGGVTFLIDPMLAEKGRYPGFPDCFNPELRNPTVELPMSADEILAGVDAIVVSHTHLDHWDEVAQKLVRKDIPLFVQDEKDAADIRAEGFTDVRVMNPSAMFGGVTLTYVEGTHGTLEQYDEPAAAAGLGETMGMIFSAKGEKTLYVMGDTVWTPRVTKTLYNAKPGIIVMNTGYAKVLRFNDSIIMGTADVAKAARLAPDAEIVTVHMDSISHCTVSKKNMREFVKQAELENHVHVPEDGTTLEFK